jgi:DNA repair exonuclease SbcCD ATPase subunit
LKLRQLNDLEVKNSQLNIDTELKTQRIQLQDKTIIDVSLHLELVQSQLRASQTEKQHLDLQHLELTTQKEQLDLKFSRTHNELETITVELQEAKRQLIGIDEVKKDRDERIGKLRHEI